MGVSVMATCRSNLPGHSPQRGPIPTHFKAPFSKSAFLESFHNDKAAIDRSRLTSVGKNTETRLSSTADWQCLQKLKENFTDLTVVKENTIGLVRLCGGGVS